MRCARMPGCFFNWDASDPSSRVLLQAFFLLNPLEVVFLGGNDGGAFNEMNLEVIDFLLTVGVCEDDVMVANDDAAGWLKVS